MEPKNQQNYYLPGPTKAVAITNLGETSVQVIGENKNRKQLIFSNPNETANIAICPAEDTDGNDLDAAFNGGSIVISPGGSFIVSGDCTNAWNGIANDANQGLTIWES